MAGKTGESGDICGRNLKMSTTMEIMTIESNAYRLLVEKIEKITAYVEESRNREETERKRKEEAESPATKGRKADPYLFLLYPVFFLFLVHLKLFLKH